jgi:signal transduction histidine kinase
MMAANSGVSVHLGNEDQAVVRGDEDRLRQLLLNLMENALKYTPAGGKVTLSLYRDNDWVQVAVADTGVGIAPEDLAHIFERFYRGTKNGQRHKGTGLGLAIAHWLAEAHGGHLTVASQANEGSTFTLWLPLDKPALPHSVDGDRASEGLKPSRVLAGRAQSGD